MAAPIMERQADVNQASSLLLASGFDSIETGRRVVTDCPAYAWDESDQAAMLDLANTFGEDLVKQHRDTLDRAAHRLIGTHLASEWSNRDFVAVFVHDKSAYESGATPGPDGTAYAVPSDETYWQVWQAAANAITEADLVREADLTDVFPLRTELQRHQDVLHHRLDAIAATFDDDTCDAAWQQLDGLRAAVDNAKTRSQLIEVGDRVNEFVTRIP